MLYSRGVKHTARGPEPARQRVQSGPLNDFAMCENCREVINSNFSIKCAAIPDLSTGGRTVPESLKSNFSRVPLEGLMLDTLL